MSILYLIRHGRAAAAWDVDPDPGLDELGREQARLAAESLLAHGPMDVVTSPMARARETAQPFAQAWQLEPRVEAGISEIPSPTTDLAARGAWLRELADQKWPSLDQSLWDWRQGALAALEEAQKDTVFLSHFMVINAVLAAVLGKERVVSFRPDYCSISVLRNDKGRLSLISRGAEANTRVV